MDSIHFFLLFGIFQSSTAIMNGIPVIMTKGRQRILTTQVATRRYPWMASIRERGIFGGHICSGSLIRTDNSQQSKALITAASCVRGKKNVDVVLGAHNRKKNEKGQMTRTATPIPHPYYDPVTGSCNIALLVLSKPVDFTDTIKPIGLPAKTYVKPADSLGMVTGWGASKANGKNVDELRVAGIPIVEKETCQQEDRAYDHVRMFCAGYYKQRDKPGICSGDMGNPYFFLNDDKRTYTLYGVASHREPRGADCGHARYLSVFTKVPWFTDWIEKALRSIK